MRSFIQKEILVMKSSTLKKGFLPEKDKKESVTFNNSIEKMKKKYSSLCKDEHSRSVSFEDSTSYQRPLSEARTYYSRQDSGVSSSSFSSCFSLIGLSLKVHLKYA